MQNVGREYTMSSNPFKDITDPAELRALVQDGVKCEACERGKVIQHEHHALSSWSQLMNCPTCSGTGHTPLPNADLDALAAKWCGSGATQSKASPGKWILDGRFYKPTTDPVAAMRLQVKYNIGIGSFLDGNGKVYRAVRQRDVAFKENTVEARCYAITKTALTEALTDAMP